MTDPAQRAESVKIPLSDPPPSQSVTFLFMKHECDSREAECLGFKYPEDSKKLTLPPTPHQPSKTTKKALVEFVLLKLRQQKIQTTLLNPPL